jgi:hypothetical protein
MLVTCANCLRKILPKSNGCCPACNTPVDENADEPEPVHELTGIRRGQPLPAICFNCGVPATSFTMVKFEGELMPYQAAGGFILRRLFPALFRPRSSSILSGTAPGKRDSFRVDLPSCTACTDMDETKFLRGVDQASRTIRIAAHRDFTAALKRGS